MSVKGSTCEFCGAGGNLERFKEMELNGVSFRVRPMFFCENKSCREDFIARGEEKHNQFFPEDVTGLLTNGLNQWMEWAMQFTSFDAFDTNAKWWDESGPAKDPGLLLRSAKEPEKWSREGILPEELETRIPEDDGALVQNILMAWGFALTDGILRKAPILTAGVNAASGGWNQLPQRGFQSDYYGPFPQWSVKISRIKMDMAQLFFLRRERFSTGWYPRDEYVARIVLKASGHAVDSFEDHRGDSGFDQRSVILDKVFMTHTVPFKTDAPQRLESADEAGATGYDYALPIYEKQIEMTQPVLVLARGKAVWRSSRKIKGFQPVNDSFGWARVGETKVGFLHIPHEMEFRRTPDREQLIDDVAARLKAALPLYNGHPRESDLSFLA